MRGTWDGALLRRAICVNGACTSERCAGAVRELPGGVAVDLGAGSP
jgi:hypothetical protein